MLTVSNIKPVQNNELLQIIDELIRKLDEKKPDKELLFDLEAKVLNIAKAVNK